MEEQPYLNETLEMVEKVKEGKKKIPRVIIDFRDSMCTIDLLLKNIPEDGLYHNWESHACMPLVDLGLFSARIGMNIGRNYPCYRHPFTGESIYSSVSTMAKAHAEAWAAWKVNVGKLRRRHPLGADSLNSLDYDNIDRTELILRAQIEAWQAWGINPISLKCQVRERMNMLDLKYEEKVWDYFQRMRTPSPPPDENRTISYQDIPQPHPQDTTIRHPFRFAMSVPAGLDVIQAPSHSY